MYLQFDPQGLKTIHRSVIEDLNGGSQKGWLRMTFNLDTSDTTV